MSEQVVNTAFAAEQGNISVHTENIFPIIKKFLYSDHEIFLRELVSNSVDACQKLTRLSAIGEFELELQDAKVEILLDKEAKTITVRDNGLGMSAEEIKKYINQIAFSGASDFLERYKDKGQSKDQIIGQFGLGFYSAFMVASKVEIVTKSYRQDEPAARWTCDGSTSYTLEAAEKDTIGTDIILHIADDSEEFLDNWKLRSILTKYFRFINTQIELDGQKINEEKALWNRQPSELTDQDYIDFYKSLYPAAGEPLFWIHLNVEHPFSLTGILYFPKIKKEVGPDREKIQLYQRQVFITDEVKDIVPEFLLLLHGIIDSPDIPLNVSRSFLQADGNVKKITGHITKKVADKLDSLFKNERESYEAKWDQIGLFVKYGIVSEAKFAERAKDFVLIKNTEGKFFNISELKEVKTATQTDKDGNLVWLYTTDILSQHSYIEEVKNAGYQVLVLDDLIDSHFVSNLEQSNEKLLLKRVDADIPARLIPKEELGEGLLSEEAKTKVADLLKAVDGNLTTQVEVVAQAPDAAPITLVIDEFGRRFKDMYARSGNDMAAMFGGNYKIIANANHPAIDRLAQDLTDDNSKTQIARHLLDLALLQQDMLKGEALAAFIKRSYSQIN